MSLIRSTALIVALALPLQTGAASAAITNTAHDLDLQSAPSLHYSVVMSVIPAGSTIDVVSCGPRWCYVKWGASGGYCDGQYLLRYVTVKVGPLSELH